MDTHAALIIVMVVVGAISMWHSHIAAKRNKSGSCANCSMPLSKESTTVVRAGGYNYMYCQSCGKGVKSRDKVFWVLFIVAAAILVGAYVCFS
jgi:hypothetical protein